MARECAGECAGGDGGRRKERQGLAGLSRRGWSKHHRRRRRPRAAPSHAAALDIARLMSDPSQSFFRSSAHPPASAAPALRSRASASSSVPPSSARRRPLLHRRSPTPAAFAQHRGRRPADSLSLHAGAHFPPRRVLVIPSTRRPHAVSSYSCKQLRQSACHCLNTQCTPLAFTRPVSLSTVHSI